MKKEISIAVMATILILQLISNTVGGVVGNVAGRISEVLENRIQIEHQLLMNGG